VESIPLGSNLPDHDKEKNGELFDHALLGFDHDGGNPFELFEGYLVKKEGSSLICMITHASKKCIPDSETFEALGFDYKLVQVIEEWLYDSFPVAVAFESRIGAAAGSEPYTHPLLGKDHHGTVNLKNTAVTAASFVQSAVRRVLDREATSNELQAYVKKLRKKRDVPSFVVKLASSNTFLTKNVFPSLVNSIYRGILERPPTPAESKELLEYFRTVRRSGDPTKNVKQVVRRFVTGSEHMKKFLEHQSVSTAKAVKNLYRHVLGRDPESETVVQGHVATAEKEGWDGIINSLIDSSEYKSNVGLYGVPGEKTVYNVGIAALYKKFLNVGTVNSAVLSDEGKEVSKDGWSSFVEDFVKRVQYQKENGQIGFLDESDRTITLAESKKKTTPAATEKKSEDDDAE
jgi:hypothetical protein